MDIITLDWETFFDPANKYSLQCTGVTTESYVTDAKFEEILVSGKKNDGPTVWFSGTRPEFAEWLEQWELEKNALLAQNTRFDGLILAHHYGIVPRFYFDTLGMARALLKYKLKRIGLKYLAEYFGLPPKGDDTDGAMGMRRADFSPERLRRYAEYCCHDTDLTWEIFNRMKKDFPRGEYEAIDDQLRMYLVPQLELDEQVFTTAVKRCELRKQQVWDELEVQGITKAMLSSNKQFAELLRSEGIEPPLKESPAWLKKPEEERDPGKQWIYALGKADPAFIELREQFVGDEWVSAILDARVEAKSTIEQTRAEKYRQLAHRSRAFRVPTQYAGAHTGRPTGDEGLNVLNLSNPRPIKGKIDPIDGGPLLQSYLRFGVVAPEGYDIVAADLSQIEARFVAVLSGQDDLVQAFSDGQCVYSLFASDMFSRPVSKALAKVDPQAEKDRQSGKVTILGCLGGDTIVVTARGFVKLSQVQTSDLLWDGEEWVPHQGLVNSGTKETLNLCGIWLTPDHRVFNGNDWSPAEHLVQDASALCRALDFAKASCSSLDTCSERGVDAKSYSLDVTADQGNTPSTCIISGACPSPGAILVADRPANESGGLNTPGSCRMMLTVSVYSTDLAPPSAVATVRPANFSAIMEPGVSKSSMDGGRIAASSSCTYRLSRDGTTQEGSLTERIMTLATAPGIYGSARDPKTCPIEGALELCSAESPSLRQKLQTYDIAYSGPRNRFTIMTARGPLLVHNCGYGMGPNKFRASSRSQGLNLSEDEAGRFVSFYRQRYPMIKGQWGIYDDILRRLGPGGEDSIDCGPVRFFWEDDTTVAIELPNGFRLHYPNFEWGRKKKAGMEGTIQFTYQNAGDKYPRNLWGGVIMENLCQSLAYIVIKTIASDIKHSLGFRRALDVYDELIYVIPQAQTAAFMVDINPIFTARPEWCPDLPLAYEAKVGTSAERKSALEAEIKSLVNKKLPIDVNVGRSYGHV